MLRGVLPVIGSLASARAHSLVTTVRSRLNDYPQVPGVPELERSEPMHGRRELVTAQQIDHWLAMRRAAAAAGLDAAGAQLIHHYSNAIYLLPAQNAIARITYGHEAAGRRSAVRSQAITRWLAQERHFPATEPLGDTSPVTVDTAVVSFWTYYQQLENAPPLTSAHLAIMLRLLHQSETPPVALPTWVPLASLHATVADPALSAVLTADERAWMMDRITEVRDKIVGMDWPLGTGLIHGDAWAGNLMSSPSAAPWGAAPATGPGSAPGHARST